MVNKIYTFFDDEKQLEKELEDKSMSQYARKLCDENPYLSYQTMKACIRYYVHKHFGNNKEKMNNIYKQKAFHKKLDKLMPKDNKV